jgi:hypothetical protein
MNDHNKQVTLKYLKEKVERENIELNDNYILNEKLVAVCIKLIEKCTGFAKYLRMNKFNTYEIPYAVFSELSSYINEKFLNEEFLLIKSEPEYIEILQILMEMLSS